MKEVNRKIKEVDIAVVNADNIDWLSDDQLRSYVANQIRNARKPNMEMLHYLPFKSRKELIEAFWNFYMAGEGQKAMR